MLRITETGHECPVSEPYLKGELSRDPAEIDSFVEETLIDSNLPAHALIPHLSARSETIAKRHAEAPEDEAPDVMATRDEPVAEDIEVTEIDELPDLAVSPIEEADTHAEVWLHGCLSTEGQHANRRGQGNNPQAKVLGDLRAIDVYEVGVDARDGPLIEAHTDTSIKVVPDADQPFRADRTPAKVEAPPVFLDTD